MPIFAFNAVVPLVFALLAWAGLGATFLLWARPGSGSRAHGDPRARAGMLVQGLALFVGFTFRRPVPPELATWEAVVRWSGAALAWGSVFLAAEAVRSLGNHWSLDARVLEGHRLVREGPYAVVRHPIYTALLGLLVGTGANLTQWPALALAVLVYLAGTRLRTRAEEALLTRELGPEYARYAAEVPALLPRPPGRGSSLAR
jgi:protein-S-isoprenylcysteine O-methyltransferase Ste14